MRISVDTQGVGNVISAYDQGVVTINGKEIRRNIIVTRNQLIDWSVTNIHDMTQDQLAPVFACEPEILLLGTGQQHHVRTDFMLHAIRAGMGLEIMTTHAACRTYNVLIAEGRNVAAALIISD